MHLISLEQTASNNVANCVLLSTVKNFLYTREYFPQIHDIYFKLLDFTKTKATRKSERLVNHSNNDNILSVLPSINEINELLPCFLDQNKLITFSSLRIISYLIAYLPIFFVFDETTEELRLLILKYSSLVNFFQILIQHIERNQDASTDCFSLLALIHHTKLVLAECNIIQDSFSEVIPPEMTMQLQQGLVKNTFFLYQLFSFIAENTRYKPLNVQSQNFVSDVKHKHRLISSIIPSDYIDEKFMINKFKTLKIQILHFIAHKGIHSSIWELHSAVHKHLHNTEFTDTILRAVLPTNFPLIILPLADIATSFDLKKYNCDEIRQLFAKNFSTYVDFVSKDNPETKYMFSLAYNSIINGLVSNKTFKTGDEEKSSFSWLNALLFPSAITVLVPHLFFKNIDKFTNVQATPDDTLECLLLLPANFWDLSPITRLERLFLMSCSYKLDDIINLMSNIYHFDQQNIYNMVLKRTLADADNYYNN